MNQICETIIRHSSAWRSSDFASLDEISISLGQSQIEQMATAIRGIRAQDLSIGDLTAEHFVGLEDVARELREELRHGRGIVVVRGFPVEEYPEDDIGLMFYGLGAHLGSAVPQSVLGDLLGHMEDHSHENPNARAYRNKQELDLHTDMSEIVAVLCLAPAVTGGESQFSSIVSIHNDMLSECPELLPALYEGFRYHRAGEEGPGDEPVSPWKVPVFAYQDECLSARYIRGYIERGATIIGEPLSSQQQAALNQFDAIAKRSDLMLNFKIARGDAVFFNNYLTLHARSAFEDDPALGPRRHLLRLWLDVEDGRPAPSKMNIFGTVGITPQEGKSPTGEGDAYKALLPQSDTS